MAFLNAANRTCTMSILTSPKPYAFTAPDIQRKLHEAQDRLRPLEASQGEVALDAELGVPGAQDRLTQLLERIAVEKASLAKLRLAHSAGLARDAEAERTHRAGLRKAQIAALRKHLEARDAAASAMAVAITEAVKQFKLVVERSRKAGDIVPICDQLPEGAISGFGQLKSLVGQEIYRLDGGDSMTGTLRSFPGAAVLDINTQGQPNTIEPLEDHLKRNSAYIIETITGRAG
jgi:hypothetical protein